MFFLHRFKCFYVTNQSNVRIVPSVVVHQSGAVAHAGDLVAVIPPGHDAGIFVSVLPEPVVRFAEIVNDLARSTIEFL